VAIPERVGDRLLVLDQGGGELEGASVRRLADVAAGG
jgi:hypothetical protein